MKNPWYVSKNLTKRTKLHQLFKNMDQIENKKSGEPT